ncbi:MAG: PASTA domain-containing protein [Burkholderiaceae bacterium]|nr:PASTA domain-containing protein [Burkholderiaceae bacterium]
MRVVKPAVRVAAFLVLLGCASSGFAQRLLCTQLPASERERARATGQCRDSAPIIDVVPKQNPTDPAQDSTITPRVLPGAAATGAGALPVPNVVGQSFDEARAQLARFTLQRSYRAAAEVGGTVLAQTPMAPASLPAGAPVSLVLSDGSLVRVPRVTSVNINEARQRLQKDLDLKAQPVVITSEQRVGTVIEQQPAEGTLVKRGSVVRLQVSAGQEGPELIDVPNVVGMPFDRAKARLARFSVERVDRPGTASPGGLPEGQIIEQVPRAATRAATGSAIVLTVAAVPRAVIEVFEMPNVIGRSYADAARSLAEFKITRSEADNAAPRDQIVAQTPAAGTTLLPGAPVALQVSAGSVTKAGAAAGSTDDRDHPTQLAAGREVLTGVLAISAAVVLGLIVGGLVMRQLLLRQRAVLAADDAITAMSGLPELPAQGLTSVDILLEDQAATASRPDQRDSDGVDQDKDADERIAGDEGKDGDQGRDGDEGKGSRS